MTQLIPATSAKWRALWLGDDGKPRATAIIAWLIHDDGHKIEAVTPVGSFRGALEQPDGVVLDQIVPGCRWGSASQWIADILAAREEAEEGNGNGGADIITAAWVEQRRRRENDDEQTRRKDEQRRQCDQLVRTLDHLGVPYDTNRLDARQALHAAGLATRTSNQTLLTALQWRRQRAGQPDPAA
jgi:hypothetical protein